MLRRDEILCYLWDIMFGEAMTIYELHPAICEAIGTDIDITDVHDVLVQESFTHFMGHWSLPEFLGKTGAILPKSSNFCAGQKKNEDDREFVSIAPCLRVSYYVDDQILTLEKKMFGKNDMAALLANQCGLTKKQSGEILDAIFSPSGIIATALASEKKVQIHGFGNFKLKHREGRTGRNPQTGEPLVIAAKSVITWKASSTLNAAFN